MAAVVNYCECLLVGPRVRSNLVLQRKKELLGFGKVEVLSVNNVRVLVEAVLLDVLAEYLHVLYDFR